MTNKTRIVAALLASGAFVAPATAQTTVPPAEQTPPNPLPTEGPPVDQSNTIREPSTQEPPLEAGAPAVTETEPGQNDIIVTGIRASQAKSIDIKRESAAIVDAITAEDIGKLPDVTIVDSLQRIPGVQITRNAGEGSTFNIRGLPQVVTLINGEQFLSAGNIGSSRPSLLDIPAQLLSGAVVYKTQDVRNAYSGISGTVDLRTRRPFDFKDGFTFAGQAEYETGRDTSKDDYLASGLAAWRKGNIGVLATVSNNEATLGNNYAGYGGGIFGNNDWGGDSPNWIAPQGYETFHREVERKRFGASGAIQWEIEPGVTVTGEGFYTRFHEHDLRAGMNISNRWTGLGWTTPTDFVNTGLIQQGGGNGQPWYAVSQYDLDAWWVNSFSINRTTKSDSKNFNLQLDYDKGGPFSFTARAIYEDAKYLNTNGQVQGDLSNWQYGPDRQFTLFRDANDRTRGPFYPANIAQNYAGRFSNGIIGSNGGRYVNPNPMGYGADPQLHIDLSHNDVRWSGFDTPIPGGLGAGRSLQDYMANLDSYTVAAYSSEGNNRNTAKNYGFRLDGAYEFAKSNGGNLFDVLKRVDFGVRGSKRKAEIEVYHLFSNLYAGNGASDPNGCAVQWKSIDVVLNNQQPGSCFAGEQVPNAGFDPNQPVSATNPVSKLQGYTAYQPTNLGTNNNTYFLTDFGKQTKGFPGVWVADPRDFNDPLAFQTRVFGNAFPVIIPGASYDVNFYETSAYANADLEYGPVEANVGLKYIHTRVRVRQNLTGAVVPYGDANYDVGDYFDGNSYDDWLPTVNVQWNVTDKLKVRGAFAKTTIPLDLGNYGSGLSIATNDSIGVIPDRPETATNAPIGVRQVTSASSSGNPNLKPWRSNNYDAAVEYYYGRATLLSVGLYKLDINSFVNTQTLLDGRFPDGDGVIRRTVNFTRPVQGDGGSLKGVEVGAKVSAGDFLKTNSFIRFFGFDANYTYSDSAQKNSARQLNGDYQPFFDNSTHQVNFALWYQDSRLQARAAYNYRSARLQGSVDSVPYFAAGTNFVDLNVTYMLNEHFSLYANASNVFGEIEKYYYEFDKGVRQFAYSNEFEPRYFAGVRVKF